MVASAREEALNAVEFFNRPGARRPLESFFVHMHIAWLYLLQAEFERDKVDYYYRQGKSRRFQRVDGEKKSWELDRCVRERWPEPQHPVRLNLELTIKLRNKVEHRYEKALAVKSQGFCQSLIINFEDELIEQFGPANSISDMVTLPISLNVLSREGMLRLLSVQKSLPKKLDEFILQYRAGLADEAANDRRFELRLDLIQKRASATQADLAVSFVNEANLTPAERKAYEELEKSGRVILREKFRPVSNSSLMRPKVVSEEIQKQIPFLFRPSTEFPRVWKSLKLRPGAGAKGAAAAKTDERYCIYDEAHGDYVYTPACVAMVVDRCSTREGFEELTGLTPKLKDR